MDGIEKFWAIIGAVIVFIIGLLLAIPSPIDLAIIIAEAFRSVMPAGTPTQMLETWILSFRILGFVLILAEIIGFVAYIRSKL